MKCPACNDTDLLMTERRGVEIDYCPLCRGVWLDRGELDVILERSAEAPTATRQESGDRGHDAWSDETRHGHGHDDRHPRAQKRGGLLSDLFGGLGGD